MRHTFFAPLPPSKLTANSKKGSSRISKAAATAGYRGDVATAALALMGGHYGAWPTTMATVSLVFQTGTVKPWGRSDGHYRPRDEPNAIYAFKAGFDGLKDAGLLVDDDYKHMHIGSVTIDPKAGPGVIVTVEWEA